VTSPTPICIGIGLSRGIIGALTLAVLGYAYSLNIAAGDGNPLDYFGYFTNQTSLIMGVLLITTGILTIVGRQGPDWLTPLRGVATTCLIVVAIIYNTLVPGTGTAPPWVSAILHVILPAFVVLDWVLVDDHRPLRWHRLWIVLPYPLVWLVVVLARGATDGWVPYGFLLPENGTLSLGLHIAVLLSALTLAGAVVWWTSRLSIIPITATSRNA